MLFAITDIETTGSYAAANGITEIAICIHDGEKIIKEYETLINPGVHIPRYITALTGITEDMLADAPPFEEVADEIHALLKDCVFVAHNVNFDYSFIKASFDAMGYAWQPKKLCTVRLSKKAFPGMRSYGLANLCREMDIVNERAHRAMSDTRATAEIFRRAFAVLGAEEVEQFAARGTGETFLPNHIPTEEYKRLPERPGIYYFLDQSGKPIYVGKAVNIKKRVKSHFQGSLQNKRLQEFLKEIHHIDFTETGNELIALLVEDAEIRKHWPKHNSAQKRRAQKFAVYSYTDQQGYTRLAANKNNATISAIKQFSTLSAAQHWLMEFGEKYELHLKLIGFSLAIGELPHPEEHNEKVTFALEDYLRSEGSYLLHSRGRTEDENAFVLIKNGSLKGYGFVPREVPLNVTEELENWLTPLAPTEVNAAIIRSFIEQPKYMKLVPLSESQQEA